MVDSSILSTKDCATFEEPALRYVSHQWDAVVLLIQHKRSWRNLVRIKAVRNKAGAFLVLAVHAFAPTPAWASLLLALMKSI